MSSKKTYDLVSETTETTELETPQETPKVETKAGTYTVQDGDSWPSIADTHRPAGTTTHKYAEHLFAINGGSLTPGQSIKL